MDGQLDAHIVLDDIYAAVQRVHDVVAAAETYSPEALHESLEPLMQDIEEAKMMLGGALSQLEAASIKTDTGRS